MGESQISQPIVTAVSSEIPSAEQPPKASAQRIVGLDSIRFVLALWVVLGHFGPALGPTQWRTGPAIVARLVVNNLFNGPAAVIAFFVISGLCIHYPNRRMQSLPILPFYLRREVRILIPVACMLAMSRAIGVKMSVFNDSILWSLICEEIYYFLYPLILVAMRRVGARLLFAAGSVCSIAVVALVPNATGDYAAYGAGLNWIVGLPCWLLGCILAEEVDAKDLQPNTSGARSGRLGLRGLWVARFAVFLVSMLTSVLRFHSFLTFQWTLNAFAVVCFFWIRREIRFYAVNAPPRLERFGLASYSIYLVHVHARQVWLMLSLPDWLIFRTPFILGFAFVFYRIVEAPSHQLARSLYRKAVTRGVTWRRAVDARPRMG